MRPLPLRNGSARVSPPVVHRGRRALALRLGGREGVAVFEAVAHGEFAVSWFHNGDLRRLLDPTASNASPCDRRRLSAKTSRRLRLLRDHGVIGKVPKTHRHSLTAHGELLAAVLFATRRANIKQLLDNAT